MDGADSSREQLVCLKKNFTIFNISIEIEKLHGYRNGFVNLRWIYHSIYIIKVSDRSGLVRDELGCLIENYLYILIFQII